MGGPTMLVAEARVDTGPAADATTDVGGHTDG